MVRRNLGLPHRLISKNFNCVIWVYRAFDGTEANVTFTTGTKEGNFILIERNKLKIELPQIESDIYEKDGIKAVSKGDLLTITQNGQIFELSRKK